MKKQGYNWSERGTVFLQGLVVIKKQNFKASKLDIGLPRSKTNRTQKQRCQIY